MAAKKYLITSNFRDGRFIGVKGNTIELDDTDATQGQKIALLNHAGRLAENTPENVKAIQEEIRRDKEREEILARQTVQNSGTRQPQQARATA